MDPTAVPVTVTLTPAEVAALNYWYTVDSGWDMVAEATGVDMHVVLAKMGAAAHGILVDQDRAQLHRGA